MAQKTLKLKGVTAVGFFVGDYYLRPENMRLQKKYTICLEFHVGIKCIFSSNQIIHKISFSLCFWAPDPLIDKFY